MMFYALFSYDTPKVWLSVLLTCFLAGGGFGICRSDRKVRGRAMDVELGSEQTDFSKAGGILFARRVFISPRSLPRLACPLALIAVTGFGIPPYIVPRPLAVLDAFAKLGRIARHAGFTLSAAGSGSCDEHGLCLAIAIGFSMSPLGTGLDAARDWSSARRRSPPSRRS